MQTIFGDEVTRLEYAAHAVGYACQQLAREGFSPKEIEEALLFLVGRLVVAQRRACSR